VQFLRLLRKPKALTRGVDDAQLKLYSELLPGGFMNYGHFDPPDVAPERLSLQDIEDAQVRYGQLLIDQIRDRERPVLDAGCGMGGLLRLLIAQGFSPTGLTPNRDQIAFLRSRYSQISLIESRFEAVPADQYAGRFGTVITSESFQYMELQGALEILWRILVPGGRWILCDYFRTGETKRRSGHREADFTAAALSRGWRIVHRRDVTANALAAVGYVHMWGVRVGLPLLRFGLGKLHRKRPALHYLFEDFFEDLSTYLRQELEVVDPEIFRREKAYLLYVLERP
jgi:SAM-dependent methyltransferase